MYMWLAVDSEGEVLDVLVQSRRDKTAALRLKMRDAMHQPHAAAWQARDVFDWKIGKCRAEARFKIAIAQRIKLRGFDPKKQIIEELL